LHIYELIFPYPRRIKKILDLPSPAIISTISAKEFFAMVDMKVFLAEKDGVKLATKELFWKVATPDMWAVDPKLIWEFLRINGWIEKDIKAARTARRPQMPEVKARKKAQQQVQQQAQQQEKEKAFQQAVAGKNMNIFLAVDENGVKLATKEKFWKVGTPEMWAIDPKLIWEFMRKNGWIQKDIDVASTARCNQRHEAKAFQQAVAGKNMNIFLAEKDGVKLATRAQFWKEATPEMWAVNPKLISEFMQKNGWIQKDIDVASVARCNQTPEVKAKRKARNQTPEVKAKKKARRQTPEVKAKKNSRTRQRRKTDPEFKLAENLRKSFKRIKKFLIEANVMTEEEVKQFKQNCKDNDSYYAQHFRHYLEKTLPDGVTWMDWTGNKTDLHIDHVFPVIQAVKNSELFPGLLEFVQSPWNAMFLDGATNKSKSDKIILELIPKNCPGYPFTDLKEVYQTVEEAGLPRAPFEKWLEIKKILENL